MPNLSIIIVHHQTPELLKLCLKSIRETSADLDYEIIVVDSTISRKAKDMINERYPEIRYLPFKENLGYARGVNAGIKNSSGKYILILNPDVIVTDDVPTPGGVEDPRFSQAKIGTIRKMMNYMDEHSDIGMLGPRVLNFNGTHQKTYFSYYKPITVPARRSQLLGRIGPFKRALDDFLMNDTDPAELQTPDWIMGSALMVRRVVADQIGGMDERFFMYFEDVDWARRFWHNDYKVIYYPDAVMYHYHQRESSSRLGIFDTIFNKKTRWHISSAIKFFWKYRDLRKIELAK